MSSKSANYCCSYASGGEALLLLCEAELGNPMQVLTNASSTAGDDALAKNMYSTWGQGQTAPQGWKDAKSIHPSLAGVKVVSRFPGRICRIMANPFVQPDVSKKPGATKVSGAYLQYNEFICYDVSQVCVVETFVVSSS